MDLSNALKIFRFRNFTEVDYVDPKNLTVHTNFGSYSVKATFSGLAVSSMDQPDPGVISVAYSSDGCRVDTRLHKSYWSRLLSLPVRGRSFKPVWIDPHPNFLENPEKTILFLKIGGNSDMVYLSQSLDRVFENGVRCFKSMALKSVSLIDIPRLRVLCGFGKIGHVVFQTKCKDRAEMLRRYKESLILNDFESVEVDLVDPEMKMNGCYYMRGVEYVMRHIDGVGSFLTHLWDYTGYAFDDTTVLIDLKTETMSEQKVERVLNGVY